MLGTRVFRYFGGTQNSIVILIENITLWCSKLSSFAHSCGEYLSERLLLNSDLMRSVSDTSCCFAPLLTNIFNG